MKFIIFYNTVFSLILAKIAVHMFYCSEQWIAGVYEHKHYSEKKA